MGFSHLWLWEDITYLTHQTHLQDRQNHAPEQTQLTWTDRTTPQSRHNSPGQTEPRPRADTTHLQDRQNHAPEQIQLTCRTDRTTPQSRYNSPAGQTEPRPRADTTHLDRQNHAPEQTQLTWTDRTTPQSRHNSPGQTEPRPRADTTHLDRQNHAPEQIQLTCRTDRTTPQSRHNSPGQKTQLTWTEDPTHLDRRPSPPAVLKVSQSSTSSEWDEGRRHVLTALSGTKDEGTC
eukprot:XP_014037898.1 PREDICTED: uncharacterized protein LOC106591210 [Salmo salar]